MRNNLPVLTYTNIWRTLEVNENIVTRIFLTKILQMKLTRITVVAIATCKLQVTSKDHDHKTV